MLDRAGDALRHEGQQLQQAVVQSGDLTREELQHDLDTPLDDDGDHETSPNPVGSCGRGPEEVRVLGHVGARHGPALGRDPPDEANALREHGFLAGRDERACGDLVRRGRDEPSPHGGHRAIVVTNPVGMRDRPPGEARHDLQAGRGRVPRRRQCAGPRGLLEKRQQRPQLPGHDLLRLGSDVPQRRWDGRHHDVPSTLPTSCCTSPPFGSRVELRCDNWRWTEEAEINTRIPVQRDAYATVTDSRALRSELALWTSAF